MSKRLLEELSQQISLLLERYNQEREKNRLLLEEIAQLKKRLDGQKRKKTLRGVKR